MMPKASAIAGSSLAVCLDIHRQRLLQLAADVAQHTSDFTAHAHPVWQIPLSEHTDTAHLSATSSGDLPCSDYQAQLSRVPSPCTGDARTPQHAELHSKPGMTSPCSPRSDPLPCLSHILRRLSVLACSRLQTTLLVTCNSICNTWMCWDKYAARQDSALIAMGRAYRTKAIGIIKCMSGKIIVLHGARCRVRQHPHRLRLSQIDCTQISGSHLRLHSQTFRPDSIVKCRRTFPAASDFGLLF